MLRSNPIERATNHSRAVVFMVQEPSDTQVEWRSSTSKGALSVENLISPSGNPSIPLPYLASESFGGIGGGTSSGGNFECALSGDGLSQRSARFCLVWLRDAFLIFVFILLKLCLLLPVLCPPSAAGHFP